MVAARLTTAIRTIPPFGPIHGTTEASDSPPKTRIEMKKPRYMQTTMRTMRTAPYAPNWPFVCTIWGTPRRGPCAEWSAMKIAPKRLPITIASAAAQAGWPNSVVDRAPVTIARIMMFVPNQIVNMSRFVPCRWSSGIGWIVDSSMAIPALWSAVVVSLMVVVPFEGGRRSPDQGAEVVVEEDAVRVEAPADRDERIELGIEPLHAWAGHEVQLPPVRAGVERVQDRVDVAQVRPVVRACFDRDRDDACVAVELRGEVPLVRGHQPDLDREDLVGILGRDEVLGREEGLAADLGRHEVLELVEDPAEPIGVDAVGPVDPATGRGHDPAGLLDPGLVVHLGVGAVDHRLAGRCGQLEQLCGVVGRAPEEGEVAVGGRVDGPVLHQLVDVRVGDALLQVVRRGHLQLDVDHHSEAAQRDLGRVELLDVVLGDLDYLTESVHQSQ